MKMYKMSVRIEDGMYRKGMKPEKTHLWIRSMYDIYTIITEDDTLGVTGGPTERALRV